MKKQSLIRHSFCMLARNYKSYFMLSITLVLSFVILAGFLLYTDSSLYNKYKIALSSPENVVIAEQQCEREKCTALINMAKIADPDVCYYSYLSYPVQQQQYSEFVVANFFFMPEGNQPILVQEFVNNGAIEDAVDAIHELEIVAGKKELYDNEAIISENFYELAFPDSTLPFQLNVPMELADGTTKMLSLEVVGICEDSTYNAVIYDDDTQKYQISCTVYCLQNVLGDLTEEDLDIPNWGILFVTDSPETIADCAEQLGFAAHCAYEMRNEATQAMRNASRTKLYVSIMLLLILGVNLFGCFENALNDRKFEIGVKRAIGASRFKIICQFLIEGMGVMIANVLLATTLVSCGAAVYKLYRHLTYGDCWVVYLTPYSIATFCVCSISMSLLFSVIFSLRSSRVEIVKYLKAE